MTAAPHTHGGNPSPSAPLSARGEGSFSFADHLSDQELEDLRRAQRLDAWVWLKLAEKADCFKLRSIFEPKQRPMVSPVPCARQFHPSARATHPVSGGQSALTACLPELPPYAFGCSGGAFLR